MNAHGQSDTQPSGPGAAVHLDPHRISVDQLARLGVSQIAYVKPVVVNGATAFAIFGADGTPMAVTEDREVAIAAIRQHEMLAALVH